MILVFDKNTRRVVEANKLQLTNLLFKAKYTKKPWEVVDLVVETWKKKEPKKYKSYLIRLKDIKETRKKTRIGKKYFLGVSRDDKVNNAITSYLLDIPEWIILCLRKLYNVNELQMDKEFFYDFGKRYPIFKIRDSA